MILEDAARLEELAAEVTVLRRSQQYGQSLAHRRQLVDALLTRTQKAWASSAALSERLGEAAVIISALREQPSPRSANGALRLIRISARH